MGEQTEGRRSLAKGDRIEAHPCLVTICMVAGPTAGWCETCADHHIIDRQLYEAGGGPWRIAASPPCERRHPVSAVGDICALCGKRAEGFAAINDDRYCHGDTKPSCYEIAQIPARSRFLTVTNLEPPAVPAGQLDRLTAQGIECGLRLDASGRIAADPPAFPRLRLWGRR